MGMKDRYRDAHRAKVEAQRAEQTKRPRRRTPRDAPRAEQYQRYLDAGPQAWDDRDPGPDY